MITKENNRLIIKDGFGTVWIEPWGKDSVRVRMTAARAMDKNDWALGEGKDFPSLQPASQSFATPYARKRATGLSLPLLRGQNSEAVYPP